MLEMLPEHPVLSPAVVAERFDVSAEAARQALRRLEGLGVLSPNELRVAAPGRPSRWRVADELLEVVRRWA